MKLQCSSLALAWLLAAAPCAAQADGFSDMQAAWQTRLTGGPTPVLAGDADADGARQALQRQARQWLDGLQRDPQAAGLWRDLSDWNNPYEIAASGVITSNYRRLAQMAQAWATPGTPLYHDSHLRDAVLYGLDWMNRHHYHAGQRYYGNWWHWQIGAPLQMANALVLMGDAVAPELLARCLAAIDHFVPEAEGHRQPDGALRDGVEHGANLLDKVLLVALRGVLGKSADKVRAARAALSPALPYVTQGDGFYADGSFIQHFNVAYTGNYGVVALEDMARLIGLFAAGPWPVTDPQLTNVYAWARNAYIPLVVDGAMLHTVRGRKISEPDQTDHGKGRGVAAALADLAQSAPAADAAFLRATVKGWMVRDHSFGPGYFGTPGSRALPLYDLRLLKALAADTRTPAAAEPQGVKLFPAMDRAVMRGPGFGIGFSLFSPRISAFEYGNRENARGWWTGIGMVSLYNGDQDQFGGNYWATVDAQRLPGITTDHSASGTPREWFNYANKANWSGGAVLDGRYGVLGMAFDMGGVTGSVLSGNKAWFMFGDKVLALGSAIRNSGATETIVDNRKIGAGAVLLVDGKPAAAVPGRMQPIGGAHWAHLAASPAAAVGAGGADIGYCFPQTATLETLREQRSGKWADIHVGLSTAEVRDSYISLALPHGAAPQDAGYGYLLLPGVTPAATAAYCASPGIRTEDNTADVAAASDADKGLYAAAFWRAGTARRDGRPWLQSDAPLAAVLRVENGQLAISLADPTREAGAVEVQVMAPARAALRLDPAVEVLQLQPVLRLRVQLQGKAGQAVAAAFALVPRAGDAVTIVER